MGNKRKGEERKELITIRLKKSIIEALKKVDNYNQLIENIIIEYFDKQKNKD